MKTAGRAFTMGMFGTMGVAAAILVPVGIAVLVGERKLRRIFAEFEADMKKRTEDLLSGSERGEDG